MVIVEYMARTTLIVTDKNFRITIPEEVRVAEGIRQGDIIEVDVKNLGKQEDWDCRKKIFTEQYYNNVKIDSTKNAIITLLPGATTNRIRIPTAAEYGIELTLKDTEGNELPDSAIITLWKQKLHLFDSSAPSGDWLEDCTYGELKRKVKPRNEILILPDELLALYLTGNEYIKKGIHPENIRFTVDLCTKR